MTTTAPFTRIATFHAGPGDADRLAEALLRAATIVADAPGCELWLGSWRPGRDQGGAHRHGVVEEIYVVLTGSGRIKVDDDSFDVRALDAVRVAPGSAREFAAGGDGLELLAFGPHSPADGEMVTDWAPA